MNLSDKELEVLTVVAASAGPVKASAVALTTGRTVSSVSASLKRLVDQGLVGRIQFIPKFVSFALTDAGRDVVNPPVPAKVKGAPLTTGERYTRLPVKPTGPQHRRYTHKLNKLDRRMREAADARS